MTLLIKTAKMVLIANRCHGGWEAGQKWALESKKHRRARRDQAEEGIGQRQEERETTTINSGLVRIWSFPDGSSSK